MRPSTPPEARCSRRARAAAGAICAKIVDHVVDAEGATSGCSPGKVEAGPKARLLDRTRAAILERSRPLRGRRPTSGTSRGASVGCPVLRPSRRVARPRPRMGDRGPHHLSAGQVPWMHDHVEAGRPGTALRPPRPARQHRSARGLPREEGARLLLPGGGHARVHEAVVRSARPSAGPNGDRRRRRRDLAGPARQAAGIRRPSTGSGSRCSRTRTTPPSRRGAPGARRSGAAGPRSA